jgi:LacI family transcriptional regulator
LHDITQAIAQRGMTLCGDALIETEHGFREGFEAMQAILRGNVKLTAIVCGSDYLAAGALSALDHAGVKVPEQLSVASFNDNAFAPFLHPPLTTVQLPIGEIGERAGDALIAQLRGEAPPTHGALPVQLQERASTGLAPPRATPRSGGKPRRVNR